jgi:hypothetical protein
VAAPRHVYPPHADDGAAAGPAHQAPPLTLAEAARATARLGFYRWLVQHGRLSDTLPPSPRLRFARWLVETGRLSDWPAGSAPDGSAPPAASG